MKTDIFVDDVGDTETVQERDDLILWQRIFQCYFIAEGHLML